jgi:hypothetical protein
VSGKVILEGHIVEYEFVVLLGYAVSNSIDLPLASQRFLPVIFNPETGCSKCQSIFVEDPSGNAPPAATGRFPKY